MNHSIIWGSQGRRVLFGRYGVTGLVNVDLTPDFVARLGAAFGSVLPKGSTVTINRDPHRSPRMISARSYQAYLPLAITSLTCRCCLFPLHVITLAPRRRPVASTYVCRLTTNGSWTSASSAAMAWI